MHEHLGRGFCQESMNVNDSKIELTTISCYSSPKWIFRLSVIDTLRTRIKPLRLFLSSLLLKKAIRNVQTTAQLTSPTEFRKRGNILLARSLSETDEILGMVILAQRTNSARQVARPNEAELQLLAVHPIARGQGLASRLIEACELMRARVGLSKNGAFHAAGHESRPPCL